MLTPFEDPRDFAYRIEVKENAPRLLRRALSRAPVYVVGTGDYQAVRHVSGTRKTDKHTGSKWRIQNETASGLKDSKFTAQRVKPRLA